MIKAINRLPRGVKVEDTQAKPWRHEVTPQFSEIAAKNHYFFLLQNPPTTTQLLSRVTVVAHVGYHTSIDDVLSPY